MRSFRPCLKSYHVSLLHNAFWQTVPLGYDLWEEWKFVFISVFGDLRAFLFFHPDTFELQRSSVGPFLRSRGRFDTTWKLTAVKPFLTSCTFCQPEQRQLCIRFEGSYCENDLENHGSRPQFKNEICSAK